MDNGRGFSNLKGPIGVFDSGIGGLTLVQALRHMAPEIPICYVGDTAHLPYGEKAVGAITAYSCAIADFLLSQGCQAIVVACHTASAVAGAALYAHVGGRVPIFTVVDAVLALLGTAVQGSVSRGVQPWRCGLIGTHRTVDSGVYAAQIAAYQWPIVLQALSTPLLVPVIEFSHDPLVLERVLEQYLGDPVLAGIEALILGCTHYPWIRDAVAAYYAQRHQAVTLIDPAWICAEQVAAYMRRPGHAVADRTSPEAVAASGSCVIYLSDTSPWFITGIQSRLGDQTEIRLLAP